VNIQAAWKFIYSPLEVATKLGYDDYKQRTLTRKTSNLRRRSLVNSLMLLVDRALQLLQKRPQAPVLFIGLYSRELIKQLSAHRPVLVVIKGMSERVWCIRNGIPYISGVTWDNTLTNLYALDSECSFPHTQQALLDTLREIDVFVRDTAFQLVVSFNNTSFLNRAIAWKVKELGIPVMSVQHGLVNYSTFAPDLMDGGISDYWLVWGECHKKICATASGLPTERIFALYPKKLKPALQAMTQRFDRSTMTACLLGQPLQYLNTQYGQYQTNIISAITTVCRDKGIALFYRPHPRENRNDVIREFPDLVLTPPTESIQQALQKYDIFLGSFTTALVEAATQGKIAIQLKSGETSEIIGTDGGVYYLDCNESALAAFFAKILQGEVRNIPVSHEFLACHDDLGSRFDAIVRSIAIPIIA
jgi:hypothetical protein